LTFSYFITKFRKTAVFLGHAVPVRVNTQQ